MNTTNEAPMFDHEAALRQWRRAALDVEDVEAGDSGTTDAELIAHLYDAGQRLVNALAEHGCHQ